MKRLILLATAVAVLATSCEKTEIQNEVLSPIGFTSKVNKQTKAIAGASYLPEQPFGVYAYSKQGTANAVTVMNNVEISSTSQTVEGQTSYTWKATTGTYYWPNDASTVMNFYAYSPCYNGTYGTNVPNHQKLNGTISHTEPVTTTTVEGENVTTVTTGGLNIEGYTHTNMYVDFMVADDVIGATYSDQNGSLEGTPAAVPVKFKHQMTQIVFDVQLNKQYTTTVNSEEIGAEFTLEEIKLTGINSVANYTNGVLSTTGSTTSEYVVFPAVNVGETNGCPSIATAQDNQAATRVSKIANVENSTNTFEIYPVTMLPQELANQKIIIKYKIEGEGVATEVVTKEIPLANTAAWASNKRITYKLTIGLNEILFNPSVTGWDDEDKEYNI